MTSSKRRRRFETKKKKQNKNKKSRFLLGTQGGDKQKHKSAQNTSLHDFLSIYNFTLNRKIKPRKKVTITTDRKFLHFRIFYKIKRRKKDEI